MKTWMILPVVFIIFLGSYPVLADQYSASSPHPEHEATVVDPATVLQWESPELVIGAEYDVYFGTDPNFKSGPVETSQIATTYDPFGTEDMPGLTEYFWRIDVYDPNEGGVPVTVTGDRWSFTVPLMKGLVAYYQDDPNDNSGNGHHGNLRGDAAFIDDPVRGMVLSLDGSGDYMDLVEPKTAADLGIDGNSPKSMTAWVYTRAFNDGGIFDVGAHSNGQEFCLRTMPTQNLWRIQYYGSYDIDFNYDSLNKWVHFALVHDGDYTRMYVNGILLAEGARTLNTSGSDAFRVGQYGGSGFDGLIDDFALWNYALSAEDVRGMVLVTDFDNDYDVDVADLNTLTDDWLTDNVVDPTFAPHTLDNFESYSSGGLGFPNWFQSYGVEDCDVSTVTPSLLIDDPGTPQGSKALQAVFDWPSSCGSDNNWIMVGSFLPGAVLQAQYDELRFWARTYADNDQDVPWSLYFISGQDLASAHLAAEIGPFSSREEPGVWREIVVDLRNGYNVSWQDPYTDIDSLPYISALVVQAVSDNATGARQITIDIDDIRLFDTPGCSPLPAADVNGDCIVDMGDLAILAEEWLREN